MRTKYSIKDNEIRRTLSSIRRSYKGLTGVSISWRRWRGGQKEDAVLASFAKRTFESIDEFNDYVSWAIDKWWRWDEKSRINFVGYLVSPKVLNRYITQQEARKL